MFDLDRALPQAIERGEMSAHYQPQIDLASHSIVAVEALCRWQCPTYGAVSPKDFIPAAQRLGIIGTISDFMFDSAFVAYPGWPPRLPPLSISVNISVTQLEDDRFLDFMTTRFQHPGWAAGTITVELTESMPLQPGDDVSTRLTALKSLGLHLSIDDYGVDYSSDERIHYIQPHEIKLDRSLTTNHNPETTGLLKAVVQRHHQAGRIVVAEGIETEADLARAKLIGCDRGQGYLLSKPLNSDKLSIFLAAA